MTLHSNPETLPHASSPFTLPNHQFATRTPLTPYLYPSYPSQMMSLNGTQFQSSATIPASPFYSTPPTYHVGDSTCMTVPSISGPTSMLNIHHAMHASMGNPTVSDLVIPSVMPSTLECGTDRGKKRKGGKQTKTPSKAKTSSNAKATCKNPNPKEVVNVQDDSDEDEDAGRKRWHEKYVVALIHARGERIPDFERPPKQGVNLWDKVGVKIVGLCPDFNRDSEACRKKWANDFKLYQSDNTWNQVSGNDRKESCRHYDLIDNYFSEKANVKKHVHAGAIDIEDDGGMVNEADAADVKSQTRDVKSEIADSLSPKAKNKNVAMGLLEEVLATGKEMAKSLQQHQQNESRKIQIMERIEVSFTKLVEKFTR